MANSDGRLVKRRLPVGVAISRDKNSHDKNGSEERMATGDERRFALNSHDKNGGEWRIASGDGQVDRHDAGNMAVDR